MYQNLSNLFFILCEHVAKRSQTLTIITTCPRTHLGLGGGRGGGGLVLSSEKVLLSQIFD